MASDIVDNPSRMRFETEREGHVAFLTYARHGKRLVLLHTEVPTELEGHGLGGALVAAAIDHAAGRDLVVEPQCEFAADWLRNHPDVAARVVLNFPQ